MVEELYSRKLRLSDQQREEAIKTLNANKIEMASYGARFEALDNEIASLRDSLAGTERARAIAADGLAQRESEIGACREAAEEGKRASEIAHSSIEAAHFRVASAERAMDQAYDELMAQAEKLADTQKLLEEVTARAQALEQSLG